jgi:hypothetical protein
VHAKRSCPTSAAIAEVPSYFTPWLCSQWNWNTPLPSNGKAILVPQSPHPHEPTVRNIPEGVTGLRKETNTGKLRIQ